VSDGPEIVRTALSDEAREPAARVDEDVVEPLVGQAVALASEDEELTGWLYSFALRYSAQ